MTLEEVRNEIDEIDTNMKPLFLRRMKCGKHVAVEVPAAKTLEECWQLVETSEMYLFSKENLKLSGKEPRMWIRRFRKNIKHS